MNKYLFFLLFLAINAAVFPNDSRTVLGSSVEVIDNNNTNISMQNEVINITLHKGYYEVDVTFNFFNNGPNETVLLGFPVETDTLTGSFDEKTDTINDFRSYINGNLLSEYTFRDESSSNNDYYTIYKKWYLREVTFTANAQTVSRVTYKAPYSYAGFFSFAGYIYGTGRSWKGNIGKMTVYINHGDDILIEDVSLEPYATVNGVPIPKREYAFSWEANGRYKYEMVNFKPSLFDKINIGIRQVDIYAGKTGFDDRHEGWIWDRYLLYRNEADIRLFTKNQIRLFINYFYAFHGYDFKDSFYKNYFQKFNYLSYDKRYTVNPSFTEKYFNEFERKNVNYLLRIERMMP
jgi:hypothetical protein